MTSRLVATLGTEREQTPLGTEWLFCDRVLLTAVRSSRPFSIRRMLWTIL